MAHAIQIRQTGGPGVLNWTPIEVGEPGSGQVRLRQAAAGLNYIDVYHRTGYYSQPLPFIPGLEGAGTVEAIGQDVRLKVGDRVAYMPVPAVAIPRCGSSRPVMIWLCLITMLSGRTDRLILENAHETAGRLPSKGSPVPAPSSLTLVVTTTPAISSAIVTGVRAEAAAIWRAAGVTLDWRTSTRTVVANEPSTVHVILDDDRVVSQQDLPMGWIAFSPSGVPEHLVHLSYRNATQLVDATDAYRNRPTGYKELLVGRALGRALAHELGHYLMESKGHSPTDRRTKSGRPLTKNEPGPAGCGVHEDQVTRLDRINLPDQNELFNVVASGKVRINVNQRFALKDAADAHKALEARATSGSTVLTIEPTVHRSFP